MKYTEFELPEHGQPDLLPPSDPPDPPKYSQVVLPTYISMWKFAFFCSSNNAKDLSIAHNSFTDLSRT